MATINGTGGNDSLTGTSSGDYISGSSGNDTLAGLAGADSLYGGSGTDTVDYSASNAGVSVNLSSTSAQSGGHAAGDILSSIAHAIGSAWNDTLTGNTGSNLLEGGAGGDSLDGGTGNDTLIGGTGADVLNGGGGTDMADYSASGAGVAVNLATGTGSGGDAQGDTLSNIEYLTGSAHADTLTGNSSANRLYGGDGEDWLAGGAGADSLYGGAGNDWADYSASGSAVNVNLGAGTGSGGDAASDVLSGIENVRGSGLNDSLYGGAGSNYLSGGDGRDLLDGGDNDDTLAGGAGADTLTGGEDLDLADYSASNAAVNVNLTSWTAYGGHAQGDVLTGIDGLIGSAFDDTLIGYDDSGLSGDVYTNLIFGGGGNDLIDGRGSNDSLHGGTGNDTVEGGAGDDTVTGDDGNDSLSGGTGNDSLSGGAGDDWLSGDAGNDALSGGTGNDTLVAGTGDTTVSGDSGDDHFYGSGAAVVIGGTGNDVFHGLPALVIDGGENADDMDVLDLTGMGPLVITYDPLVPENGTVTFLGPGGVPTGTLNFSNIERVIACFTPGTMIACEEGEKPVEALVPGDRVVTRDHGVQELRWIGRKRLTRADLVADPRLQPVLIRKGALGGGLPLRDMRVSRQHRMLLSGPRAELLFGEEEVLVRAEHLVHLPGVAHAAETEVTYLHILFDRHEVVLADGAWSESFQPGDRTLAGMDGAARDELFSLFPELAGRPGAWPAARHTLKRFEAKVLTAA